MNDLRKRVKQGPESLTTKPSKGHDGLTIYNEQLELFIYFEATFVLNVWVRVNPKVALRNKQKKGTLDP